MAILFFVDFHLNAGQQSNNSKRRS